MDARAIIPDNCGRCSRWRRHYLFNRRCGTPWGLRMARAPAEYRCLRGRNIHSPILRIFRRHKTKPGGVWYEIVACVLRVVGGGHVFQCAISRHSLHGADGRSLHARCGSLLVMLGRGQFTDGLDPMGGCEPYYLRVRCCGFEPKRRRGLTCASSAPQTWGSIHVCCCFVAKCQRYSLRSATLDSGAWFYDK